jgi:hypothetical protein
LPAWFRIDSDVGALQLWAGATHPLADGLGLASDMYVNSGFLGEFDIGPAITAGPTTLTPMIGVQFDWSQRKMAAIVPQFYAVGGVAPVYFELWAQLYLYRPTDYMVGGGDVLNFLYTRLFIDFALSDYIAIGPQLEMTFGVGDDQDTILSMPVGGNVMLTNYGKGNTLLFFLGYETKDTARAAGDLAAGNITSDDNAVAGRLTFIHNF